MKPPKRFEAGEVWKRARGAAPSGRSASLRPGAAQPAPGQETAGFGWNFRWNALANPGERLHIASNCYLYMADVANKYPENVPGKYYVDNQCIDCDLCRETAPDNFQRNEDGGYSYVFKQPESPEEEARCKEAKEGCPVEAIGDNGA